MRHRLWNPVSIGATAAAAVLALVAVFQLLTSPVAAHMVGRAGYRTGKVRRELLVVDELTADQAMAALEREVFDVCFLDVSIGEESGIELLPKLKSAAPWMRVVMATANSSVDSAVRSSARAWSEGTRPG